MAIQMPSPWAKMDPAAMQAAQMAQMQGMPPEAIQQAADSGQMSGADAQLLQQAPSPAPIQSLDDLKAAQLQQKMQNMPIVDPNAPMPVGATLASNETASPDSKMGHLAASTRGWFNTPVKKVVTKPAKEEYPGLSTSMTQNVTKFQKGEGRKK